jgi:hypothetical protein
MPSDKQALPAPSAISTRILHAHRLFQLAGDKRQHANALSHFSSRILGLYTRCFGDSGLRHPSVHGGWAVQIFQLAFVDHLSSHRRPMIAAQAAPAAGSAFTDTGNSSMPIYFLYSGHLTAIGAAMVGAKLSNSLPYPSLHMGLKPLGLKPLGLKPLSNWRGPILLAPR